MTPRDELAAAQASLVAALVAGGPLPPGFDDVRVAAASRALLRKRAGEVARTWPFLATAYGREWPTAFAGWAQGRPTRGSWLDGWDFARAHRDALAPAAMLELLECEVTWRRGADGTTRRRRVSARRAPGGVLVRLFGRSWLFRTRPQGR